jgi:hypothetical protein
MDQGSYALHILVSYGRHRRNPRTVPMGVTCIKRVDLQKLDKNTQFMPFKLFQVN